MNYKFPNIFNVSLDKISLMGNWCSWQGIHPFQRLINKFDSPIFINKGNNTPEVEGFIFEKVWFKTSNKQKSSNIRDFKMEFNPKRFNHHEESYLKVKIMPLLRHVGFTRLDFAFDIEEDLSNYIFFNRNNPKKITKFIGKNGKLETITIGSRESEWHVCIYNKRKERMKELQKEKRAHSTGIDYVGDLTVWEREQLEIRENWWRVEIRVRRDKAHSEISDEELFQSLGIIKPFFTSASRIQDEAIIYYLSSFPEKIEEFNYRTKKRIQELLLDSTEFDLVNLLKKSYKDNQTKLELQLKEYLAASSLKLYDVDQLYTIEEKKLIKMGQEISAEQLTFSKKVQLKYHYQNNFI